MESTKKPEPEKTAQSASDSYKSGGPFAHNVVATDLTAITLPQSVKDKLYHWNSIYSG